MTEKILSLGFLLSTTTNPLWAEELKIAIAADIHVMDKSLVVTDGTAFEAYVDQDRKMLKESTALLDELTKQIKQQAPKYLLVAGDLTKDGERICHNLVHDRCFKVLLEAGIQPLVVPGNHDINNPLAVEFCGETKRRVETITPEEFASIYADCGYGDAITRDKHSLTYIYKLTEELQLLAIDACRYEENDFEAGICRHDGVIKDSTLQFIEAHLRKAKKSGIRTIAMMHHGVVEHWKYQNKMIPGYIVKNDKSVTKMLNKYGVEVVFTGHSHAQDVSYGRGVYDVQTGSIVSYPCPYRIATIDGQKMDIESYFIDSIDFNLEGKQLKEFSRENTENGFKYYIDKMFPNIIPTEITNRAINVIAEGMTAHYGGDEHFSDEYRAEVKRLKRDIRKYSWKWSLVFRKVSRALYSNCGPADNHLTITFKKKIAPSAGK